MLREAVSLYCNLPVFNIRYGRCRQPKVITYYMGVDKTGGDLSVSQVIYSNGLSIPT